MTYFGDLLITVLVDVCESWNLIHISHDSDAWFFFTALLWKMPGIFYQTVLDTSILIDNYLKYYLFKILRRAWLVYRRSFLTFKTVDSLYFIIFNYVATGSFLDQELGPFVVKLKPRI